MPGICVTALRIREKGPGRREGYGRSFLGAERDGGSRPKPGRHSSRGT